MKRSSQVIGLLALVAVVFLGFTACKKPDKAEPEQPAVPATSVTPATPVTTAPSQPAAEQKLVPVEDYWKIQIERLENTKKNYDEIMAVYQKYPNEPDKARPEVNELQTANRQSMQDIFSKYGVSSADFYPRGDTEKRKEVLQARQQYLQENPDLKAKYQSLSTEIRELRNKIREMSGEPPIQRERREMQPGTSPAPEGAAPMAPSAPVPAAPVPPAQP